MPGGFRECRDCVCFGLRRAARVITQHYDRQLRPVGLRATQFTLLAMLVQAGPLPINRLAGLLGLERTTLTRNLRPLLAKGWLTVEDVKDRRVRTIKITAAGMAAASAALPHWRRAQSTAAAKVGDLRLREMLARAGAG